MLPEKDDKTRGTGRSAGRARTLTTVSNRAQQSFESLLKSHTFDKFRLVFPNVSAQTNLKSGGNSTKVKKMNIIFNKRLLNLHCTDKRQP